jgi:ABC-type sugar transport system substrate-binding protein
MMRFPGRRPMAVLAVLAVLAAAGPAGAAPEGTLTWGLHVTLAS